MRFGARPTLTIVARGALAVAILICALPARAADDDLSALEKAYVPEIRPLMVRYCQRCHGEERTEGDLDLMAFPSWKEVRQHPRVWQKVGEMLDGAQMPPKKARQPNDAERARLTQWVRGYLLAEARARAGDPGRVILRRLSNPEYTYTVRDLTGVESLDPAREFPVDGAAGEGFINTGGALAMSPALIGKYLDAAKEIAAHAVLLPDGFRFSPHTTRRDWTDEIVGQIREFYRQFTDPRGGDRVNLQGIVFETNEGGRLPLEKYLAAALAERETIAAGRKTSEDVARERGLNAKYLGALWGALAGKSPSLLLDALRARFRAAAPGDAAPLLAEITPWQKALWKLSSVGHIGKLGGPKKWLEPVEPFVAQEEFRFKIPPAPDGGAVTLSLVAGDAGDGGEGDFILWSRPRLVAPGRPDLPLKDVRAFARDLAATRERLFASAAGCLGAADEAAAASGEVDAEALARKHGVETAALRAWLSYLGIGSGGAITVTGHFTGKLTGVSGYAFVNGWGSPETPGLFANSSDQHVRIPGNLRPHSVAVHPSPTLRAVVGWRSPMGGTVRAEARVTHAHPECGNGVTWSLELRRGATRQILAAGTAQGAGEGKAGPIEGLAVRAGDLISLGIGPRDGNHSCDLTAVELKLTAAGEGGRVWDLAEEVSGDILAGNPHADRSGQSGVWHFYTEPDRAGGEAGPAIPPGSLLAKWQTAKSGDEKRALAADVQKLLIAGPPAAPAGGPPVAKESPDVALYRQLASLGGPLLSGKGEGRAGRAPLEETTGKEKSAAAGPEWGLDPSLFGRRPGSGANESGIDGESLCVQAPSVIEIRLPADLVAGCELVASASLEKASGSEGSAQLEIVPGKPERAPGLRAGMPILVNEGSGARRRLGSALEEFRGLFPAALCYYKIVPVDEVVTLTLYYREDDQLARLMLDDRQRQRLDRLWDELRYVSQDALTLVDAFQQLMEFATQDADPKVFEPLRVPIHERAAAFRKQLVETEPKHLDALIDFAGRAYRRPLTAAESGELRALYAKLRGEQLPHADALRLTLARVLVGPAFLYRIEKPVKGAGQGPVSPWELANRLSYFLWSGPPDEALLRAAAAGRLQSAEGVAAEARRMLPDTRTRRLAIEFACQWLHLRDFDHLDEKSDRHFPTFVSLRGAMYEESIRFFTDLFQNGGSILDILDADHTFLNEELAKHYGIPGVIGPEWRRVEGVKRFSRGGILAQASTLAKQSGASRTSPILRGNWISEVLLGERLPRPPKDVPRLPEDETATEGLTVRQLVEKHSSDPKCNVCHQRIDAFGFSLESFDAIGRRRERDLGDRPIDTRVKAMDGEQFDGLDGLRGYLLTVRRDSILKQFNRKLLGYALGRSVQLSDEPLLTQMESDLRTNGHRFSIAVDAIVRSRQFREIRGIETAYEE